MTELICKDDIVSILREKASGYAASMFGTSSEMSIARVVAAECVLEVKNAPPVDAVEVVRCKDCRYWCNEVCGYVHWTCTKHTMSSNSAIRTLPDFFCADGVRNRRFDK